MLNRNDQQLIDLLNEKISSLLHELRELRRENRKLKKAVRVLENANAENRRIEGG